MLKTGVNNNFKNVASVLTVELSYKSMLKHQMQDSCTICLTTMKSGIYVDKYLHNIQDELVVSKLEIGKNSNSLID